jgi:hypothetical protein
MVAPWIRSIFGAFLIGISLAGAIWIAVVIGRYFWLDTWADRSFYYVKYIWPVNGWVRVRVFLLLPLAVYGSSLFKKGFWLLLPFLAISFALLVTVKSIHCGFETPDPNMPAPFYPMSACLVDLRRLSIALETYYNDRGAYPPSTLDPAKQWYFKTTAKMPSFWDLNYRYDGRTGPFRFPYGFTYDEFSYITESRTFAYWAPPEGGWILISAGPNCKFDLDFATLLKAYKPNSPNPALGLIPFTYDPTNGTKSSGDIWEIHQTSH